MSPSLRVLPPALTDRIVSSPEGRDAWRLESALTYRFDRHLQAKLQYGHTRQRGDLQQSEQLVAAQLTVKF